MVASSCRCVHEKKGFGGGRNKSFHVSYLHSILFVPGHFIESKSIRDFHGPCLISSSYFNFGASALLYSLVP